MYFNSRIRGKRSLPWFDARTDGEKASDEYFGQLDDLEQELDDLDAGPGFCTSLSPDDFDSGYEYVYRRIKELQEYIEGDEATDELNSVNCHEVLESLREIYEDLLDLYDSALLYDDYCGSEPEDPDADFDDDTDNDWDNDGDDE